MQIDSSFFSPLSRTREVSQAEATCSLAKNIRIMASNEEFSVGAKKGVKAGCTKRLMEIDKIVFCVFLAYQSHI